MYDVLIIGSGPAGMSAALYAARSNLKVGVIESGLYGGQLNNTSEVENYIGVLDNNSGEAIANTMYQQMMKYDVTYLSGKVVRIIPQADHHIVQLKRKNKQLLSKSVIIATGTTNRKIGIPGEEEYSGRGVSWCAICDGAFFKGKEIYVVGGGDSAIEEGEYLSNFGSGVKVVHRRDELRATKILQERFFSRDNAEVLFDTHVTSILGDGNKVTHLELQHNDGSNTVVDADGVFIYVGLDPNTESFRDLCILDEDGYVITDNKMRTSVPGIYAIGDVRANTLRQVATAVADGAVAGNDVYHYLNK